MVRRRLAIVALTVFAVAFAVRMAPTVWTPYPFNPDGFVFAAQARDGCAVAKTGSGARAPPSPADRSDRRA